MPCYVKLTSLSDRYKKLQELEKRRSRLQRANKLNKKRFIREQQNGLGKCSFRLLLEENILVSKVSGFNTERKKTKMVKL